MESTGAYGDAMRYQFRQAGFDIYQASAKRVHDAERRYCQALAKEMPHSRCQSQAAKQLLEAKVVADEGLKEMAATVGKLTAPRH